MGNLQVRFLEGWAPAMAPSYSTLGIISGLPVIRLEPAPREFALSDVRPLSLVFRAKAAHLIRRAPRRWLRRARNRSRLLVIVRRACSSRSRHKSELRATQCCLESAG